MVTEPKLGSVGNPKCSSRLANMKNKVKYHISTLAILVVLLAPSLTYAAWWNPSTWFKKPTTPPGVKIVQVGTTMPPTKPVVATPTTPAVKKETPVVKVKPTIIPSVKTTDQSAEIENLKKQVADLKRKVVISASSSPAPDQNQLQQKDRDIYRNYLISYLNFPIAEYGTSKSYVKEITTMVEDAIRNAKKSRASIMGLRDADPNNVTGMNAMWNKLIDFYNSDIQSYEKTLSSFSDISARIEADLKLLAEEKAKMLPLSFTKEQAIIERERIDNYYDSRESSLENEIKAVADNFVKYHDSRQDEYAELFAYLKARIASLPSSSGTSLDSSRISTLPVPVLQPVQLPSYTQCSMQTLGKDTVFEQTFISCY